MANPEKIQIEVVYPLAHEQILFKTQVAEGASIRQGIMASGILQRYAQLDLEQLDVGVYGKLAKLDDSLRAKDRIEIYRPLIADPKAVRKQRAAEGKEPARIANSINYKNDFALATWAPLSLCEDGKKTYHVDIFVDKSSVELFVDGGRIAMTNLVFPVAPYENLKLYTQGGKAEFKNLKVHKLGL